MFKKIFYALLFFLTGFTLVAQKNDPQLTVIGPRFPLIKSGVCLHSNQHVVYFPFEMYGSGVLEKVEFAIRKSVFSEDGDTLGYKMPLMLKIYAQDTVNRIPGKELLLDTIIIQREKHDKMVVDLSKYNIVMPIDGIYVGFQAFSTSWYIENGYLTKDNLSYKTKGNIGGGFIFHTPVVTASIRKKDLVKYQNFVLGGWAKTWKNVNQMYQSTMVIRLSIRK